MSEAPGFEALSPAGLPDERWRTTQRSMLMRSYIETPMVADAPPGFRQAQLAANPLGILGKPEDVAHLVVYLISDESRYLSGAEIAVDGGFTAQAGAKTLFDAVRAVS